MQPLDDRTALSTLVLTDGDLPSLVALAIATARGAAGAVAALAFPMPGPDGSLGPVADDAALRQAELLGAAPLHQPLDEPATPRLLLAAAETAFAVGAASIVWPCRGESGLDQQAALCDTAVLAGRLASMSQYAALAAGTTTASAGERRDAAAVRIDTPLVDLTDEQLVELAADVEAPVETCWWWPMAERAADPDAEAAAARWVPLLEAAGWKAVAS